MAFRREIAGQDPQIATKTHKRIVPSIVESVSTVMRQANFRMAASRG